ncbi:hypothetical protein SAMN02787144_1003230 [Streptomyces atratus]|uniref:Uncharacterized protein n=1 Tax=Streptomyces atratus TaxID=1893 RepID=A0A1K1XBG6_STRAR|nr:hypothetical protein SAMN02787144_1003230 [Streptomyces atratus]
MPAATGALPRAPLLKRRRGPGVAKVLAANVGYETLGRCATRIWSFSARAAT